MTAENHLSSVEIREYSKLPALDLDWLSLKDHFIATVGPHSGNGQALKNLLVLADAKFQPKSRFPDHPHKDMEILTWVAKGVLQHYDNNGTDQSVPEGSLQLMSARSGIFHAEGNASDQEVRMLQIWFTPKSKGGTPLVDQVSLVGEGFKLLAGPVDAQLEINQDVWLYVAKVKSIKDEMMEIPAGKMGYAISIGNLSWNDNMAQDGDGIILNEGIIRVSGEGQAIIILQNK